MASISWRRWCGFCACSPDGPTDFSDLSEQEGMLEVAVKWFSVSSRRKCPICPNCEATLNMILNFSHQCSYAQGLLNELREKRVTSEEETQLIKQTWTEMVMAGPKEEQIIEEEVCLDQDEPHGNGEEVVDQEYIPDFTQNNVETEVVVETEETGMESDCPSEEYEQDEEESDEDTDELEGYEEDVKKFKGKSQERKSKDRKTNERISNDRKSKMSCRFCTKKFRTSWYLTAHERSHESPGQLPYPCDQCPKRFQSMSGLKAHSVVHSDETPFQCDRCEKGFKNSTRLKVHMETHDESKRICDICGLALNTSHSYNKHKKVHSEDRRHKCPVCPKDFKKQTALKEHLISHTGLRPYSCPFCDKTFINGSSCRLHKVKVHPVELAELEASGRSEEVNAQHRNLPSMEALKSHVVMSIGKSEKS